MSPLPEWIDHFVSPYCSRFAFFVVYFSFFLVTLCPPEVVLCPLPLFYLLFGHFASPRGYFPTIQSLLCIYKVVLHISLVNVCSPEVVLCHFIISLCVFAFIFPFLCCCIVLLCGLLCHIASPTCCFLSLCHCYISRCYNCVSPCGLLHISLWSILCLLDVLHLFVILLHLSLSLCVPLRSF